MRNRMVIVACCICSGVALVEATEPSRPSTETVDREALCASQVKYFHDGKPSFCQISRSFFIGNIQIPPASSIAFNPSGEFGSVWLGEEGVVYGQPLPAGSVLHFGSANRLRHFWLPKDTILQGHLVRGQDDGAGNRLHPNGKLLAIWLAQDEVIDGIPCTSSGNVLRMGFGVIRLGTQRMAWFYDNGRLQQAMLAQDLTLQGHSFKKGDVVSLSRDGTVILDAKKLSEW